MPACLPGGLSLSQEMGWPYRLEDWAFAAQLGQGLVLVRAGEVIGTAMSWQYGADFASVGMIIVTASAQGGGNGSRLFDGLLSALDGRNILLNSTDEGMALYQRRGFVPWGRVHQHQGVPTASFESNKRDGIRPAAAADLVRNPGVRSTRHGALPAIHGGCALRGWEIPWSWSVPDALPAMPSPGSSGADTSSAPAPQRAPRMPVV